jgi:hypothetical protein
MGALETMRETRSPVWIRALNVLLGAWLLASVFVWHHQDNVGFNDLMCGLLMAASALVAIWAPPFRWFSAGMAVWVGFSALIFEYQAPLTRLHDLALAGAVFVIALVGADTAPAGEPQVES